MEKMFLTAAAVFALYFLMQASAIETVSVGLDQAQIQSHGESPEQQQFLTVLKQAQDRANQMGQSK